MICRLCLKSINANNAVYLFETNDTLAESSLLKVITKFLQLEIMPDDNISTNICHDCCEHLEDFHNFWQLVEQKQGTLKKEFLNVDVDCVALKWTGGINVDVNIDELPLVTDEMDEKPLDIHNLSLLGSVLDVNVDSVEVPQLPTATNLSHSDQFLPPRSLNLNDNDEGDINDDDDLDQKPDMHDSSASLPNTSSSDDDDEVPLVKLQHKLKPKRKARGVTRREQRRLTLAQELNQLLDENGCDDGRRGRRKNTASETQEADLQEAMERKPKGCSRAQISKRYEEAIASYMNADCDLCDFTTKYLSELKVHFLEVHQCDGYLKCCNKVFYRAPKLMDHIRKHVNPKLFT